MSCETEIETMSRPMRAFLNKEQSEAPLALGRFLALPALLVFWLSACGRTANVVAPDQTAASNADAKPEAPPADSVARNWGVSVSTNDVTGERTTTGTNRYTEDVSFIIRRSGRKLECYLTTGSFLETIDNMYTRRSAVKYRFDDGPVVREPWIISDDNTALFCPGNPTGFLSKMRKARRLAIEYHPADVVPQTASFDVSGFPSEIDGPWDNQGHIPGAIKPAAPARPDPLLKGLDAECAELLQKEKTIAEYNRTHPLTQQAQISDIRRELCGGK